VKKCICNCLLTVLTLLLLSIPLFSLSGNTPISLNVKTFGAQGDGSTDDTEAFASALHNLADEGGGILTVPSGTYLVADLQVGSNTTIRGVGVPRPILLKRREGSAILVLYGEIAHGTRLPVHNITIESLILRGRSLGFGFKEHIHNLIAIGVNKLVIHDVAFVAFQGDGVYLGSRLHPSEPVLHNSDVIISNNQFNGTNAQNRNGISVTDCSRCILEHNWFSDITRPNMPGAIDIEPNSNDEIIRDISVRYNTVTGTNGTSALSVALLGQSQREPFGHLVIQGNFVEHANLGILISMRQRGIGPTQHLSLEVRNNIIRAVVQPLKIDNLSGEITIADNQFSTSPAGVEARRIYASCINFLGNHFLRVGTEALGAIVVGALSSIDFEDNTFVDVGASQKRGSAIYFISGTDKIRLLNNTFSSPHHITRVAVGASSPIQFAGDTITWSGNTLQDNIQPGALSSVPH
jgi:hypothetical protein